MKNLSIAIAALLTVSSLAQAQTFAPQPAPLRFVAGLGVSGGGDKLAHVDYTNHTSQNINAGSGVYFTGGVDYRVSPEFSVQATANFHVDNTSASNGDIRFQRFPFELIGYFHANDKFRVGGGLRYTTGAKLSSSGVASAPDLKYDDTTSAVVEGEYFFNPRTGVKLRYVNETFKAPGYKDTRANHFGLSGNLYF